MKRAARVLLIMLDDMWVALPPLLFFAALLASSHRMDITF
jgi:hypothetical protein